MCLLRLESVGVRRREDAAGRPHQAVEDQLGHRAPGPAERPGRLPQPRRGLPYRNADRDRGPEDPHRPAIGRRRPRRSPHQAVRPSAAPGHPAAPTSPGGPPRRGWKRNHPRKSPAACSSAAQQPYPPGCPYQAMNPGDFVAGGRQPSSDKAHDVRIDVKPGQAVSIGHRRAATRISRPRRHAHSPRTLPRRPADRMTRLRRRRAGQDGAVATAGGRLLPTTSSASAAIASAPRSRLMASRMRTSDAPAVPRCSRRRWPVSR